MLSELQQIQHFVQSVAEAIASALKVEVEIVDDQLYRVGGTGRLKEVVGSRQKRGFVNTLALKTRQSISVFNPGEHQVCSACDLKGHCFYTSGIFCPIVVEGRSIGIISLISFNETQRQTLLTNEQSFLDFTGKMADLLGGKASEYRAMQRLKITAKEVETIINTIQEGIIAVNALGEVTYFNNSAEKMLGYSCEDVIGKLITDVLPESPLPEVIATGEERVAVEVTHRARNRVHLLSNAYPVKVDQQVVGAVESFNTVDEVQRVAYRLSNIQTNTGFDLIVGNSAALQAVKQKAMRVAESSSTVLIEGESGTGKELFARAIHNVGPRSRRPFVALNCSAIPDSLLESELFGYEEGAFTGARHGGKPGKFELANGGTIFLDEIGDMPLYLQSKLLRVLQERSIERVGGVRPIPIDVRVIAATNKDLAAMVTTGEFRADLYYRLQVIPLRLPPLRERREDIPLLMGFFLEKYNRLLNKKFRGFTREVQQAMVSYYWPGNIRELENAVEYACNLELGDEITMESLPPKLKKGDLPGEDVVLKAKLEQGIKEVERRVFLEAFQMYGTTVEAKKRIADALGISTATLYRRLKELNLVYKAYGTSRDPSVC